MRGLTGILLTLIASPALGQPGVPVEVVRDVVYGTAAGVDGRPVTLTLDAAFPKESGDRLLPAVMFIHGGSYHRGSKGAGLPLVKAMAEGGYFAVSISYRLADVAPFPAAVHDGKAAVRFLRSNAGELGIDPDRIGLVGHSAGGHLGALLATSANDGALEGDAAPVGAAAVACVVVISGPVDFILYRRRPTALTRWLGADEALYRRHAAEASPLSYVDPRDPPTLIVHGTRDRLVPLEHAEILRDALSEAGVDVELMAVEGAGHDVRRPEVYATIAAFFDKHLGGRAAEVLPASMIRAAMERLGLPAPATRQDTEGRQ